MRKMNTVHIQNAVILVFLVLNLCSITPTNLNTRKPKPPRIKEQEFVPANNRTSKIRTKEREKINHFLLLVLAPKDQRVGDYRNEFKLERVIGHQRSEDGSKCITLV